MAKKKTSKNTYTKFLALARITLGLTFLWAFLDKTFGLGFATCKNPKTEVVNIMCEKAWINGGSPTLGFLKFATHGPLANFYQNLAGNGIVDLLFMAGLLLIGVTLILGIGIKISTVSGSILLIMMWSATLLPENNPIIDEHIIYAIILFAILFDNQNQKWGLRNWWLKQTLVKKYSILE